MGEALEHGDKEHEAAGPMDDEEDHADQVEDFHEFRMDFKSWAKDFWLNHLGYKE